MDNDTKIITAIIAALVGIYGWLLKHLSNTTKHPCKEDIVFRNVCDEKVKRLDDCIETQAKLSAERYETLTKKVDDGFDDLKRLVRANGNRK